MVEWRLDCEDCRHLTVVGLHDTAPKIVCSLLMLFALVHEYLDHCQVIYRYEKIC